MRIVKDDWRKTFIPFLWEQPWEAKMDTAPDVTFIQGINRVFSLRMPCDHEYAVRELHGDQRLQFDARFVDVCSKCGEIIVGARSHSEYLAALHITPTTNKDGEAE